MSSAGAWDPAQYNRFADEREQPFWDLAGLLGPVAAPAVADLGCGDGRLTALLHERLAASSTLGVDSSPAMLAAAAAHASAGVAFEAGDIGAFRHDRRFDVVFANASLQWVGEHREVIGRWAASLRPGGQLAVQVPANADHPSHVLARELGAALLGDPPPDAVAENVLAPEGYALLLDELGFERHHVRLQVYLHRLASSAEVVEWVKGTTLTRFKEPLGPAGFDRFVEEYRTRLLALLGDSSPYRYAFKRILLWGQLP